ncbi:MAG: Holliday junction resolvase RuvX [Candidatus Peribacteraceae bacterium]|nr:Holliday junction resolvase RuvX [Candidatus Peribacteraceae bacterium]
MRYLALDIGTRRTGVAYLDTEVGIALPLDTVVHTSEKDLMAALGKIFEARRPDRIVIGLPLLPGGTEGSQAQHSRKIGLLIEGMGFPTEYCDERHTSPRPSQHKNALPTQKIDGDATAACSLLSQKIDH